MADLKTTFLGIESPNPFWLASAPPTDKAYNVNRAFEAGWGGAVWKTLGEDGPPIVNVSGPRYSALHSNDRRVIGFNNIELITDRPLQTNLDEIRQVKKDWPDRALVVSVMLPMNESAWAKYLPMIEDTGADGLELNFGCPHGMSERGMGAAVGQVPEYIQMATEWAKASASIPVIVKLTPNVTSILPPARAAKDGGADAVSLINTINSIMRVDYDTLTMYPTTDGMGTHGGYCGEAVKPIALNMVAEIARTRETSSLPISGIGGVTDWRDAVDFLALGASNVQVCTAAMVYGFRIIDDLVDGLSTFLDNKGMTLDRLVGCAVPSVTDWQ
ncbi:MAG: NAD-dependent dihydropyrimidine dehydrogenase subunit PreA, partial [Gammaproteobacteria bacterium]|nr:NAD-dependent dihydropyrimidine dehydrogenase subunit PreA [Gammaproteobacteria bacterium]